MGKIRRQQLEIRGKTLGLVGYGSIGSQLSVLAEALGMNVIFYDVVTKLRWASAVQVNTLDDLLKRADIVSPHVPEPPSTQNMIGSPVRPDERHRTSSTPRAAPSSISMPGRCHAQQQADQRCDRRIPG